MEAKKKKKPIVLNLLLKPSKEIWKKKTEGIHRHNHFIREKKSITFPFQTFLIKDQISIGFFEFFFVLFFKVSYM